MINPNEKQPQGTSKDLTGALDTATKRAQAGGAGTPAPGPAAVAGLTVPQATAPTAAGSTLSPNQRSAAAFAFSQGIDRATGTGPGATLDASLKPDAPQRVDFSTMGKRFDAYQKNPDALAMANAREELLGSGINLTHGPAGGLTITSHGLGQGAVGGAVPQSAAFGGGNKEVQFAMQSGLSEGNAVMARANAIRQGMIDSQIPKGGGSSYTGNGGGGMSKEREALLDTVLTPHKGAMNGQLTANQINAARGIFADSQAEALKGAEIAQRGTEAEQRGLLDQQRLAVEQGNQAARIGIDMERFGLDKQRFGMEQRAQAGQLEDAGFVRQARQGLIDTANSKDQAAVNQARMKAIAAGIIKPEERRNEYTTNVATDPMTKGVTAITRTNKDTGAVDLIDPATGKVKSFGAGGPPATPSMDQFAAQIRARNPGRNISDADIQAQYQKSFGGS